MSTHSGRRGRLGNTDSMSRPSGVPSRSAGIDDEILTDEIVEVSSGNVFEDLGLPDASTRLAKAELTRSIRKVIAAKEWKQREAAEALGLAQSDVSDLIRGKLGRFSMERLHTLLTRLGADVHIVVHERTIAPMVSTNVDTSQLSAERMFAPAALRLGGYESDESWAVGKGVPRFQVPFINIAKWRSAPDLAHAEPVRAALARVPVQHFANLKATAGGTALQGPFVYVAHFQGASLRSDRRMQTNQSAVRNT